MNLDAFLVVHAGLPREGPGNDDATRDAVRRLPPLPANPVVLDLGCGPGRQTLVLARSLASKVIGVDSYEPYLDQLSRSAAEQGLAPLIETRLGDMGHLDVPVGTVDLIWSEGAAYILGFQEALQRWSKLLAPDGCMAVSECTWLTDDRPADAREFWQANYPEMGNVSENCRRAEAVGLEVVANFTLPAAAWWDDYYTPLLARVEALRPAASAELVVALDETEREIEMYRNSGHSYGYVFYIFRAANRVHPQR